MSERYVLLGLARARSDWFGAVARWTSAAALPAEFIRCVSREELRARLRSGRPFSAVLIDGDLPGVDRDLLADAAVVGTSVLVVDDGSGRDWCSLGADAVLAPSFSRDELVEVLAATSRMVGAVALTDPLGADEAVADGGVLLAVTGPGGTGASTTAMALAQGLAADAGRAAGSSVLLADLCRHADLALLHDTGQVVPGLQELIELHRTGNPDPTVVLEQTFEVVERGYRLLTGLRRHRHWATLRPQALDRALTALQQVADVVVADVDADTEGEQDTGALEVEERNLLARTVLARADVVLVVGRPTMIGTVGLVRTIGELLGFGVAAQRVLPVVTAAPRGARARAELTRSIAELTAADTGAGTPLAPPLFLPDRNLERAHRDATPLPSSLARPLARASTAVLERAGSPTAPPELVEVTPERVVPGSLGTAAWEDE